MKRSLAKAFFIVWFVFSLSVNIYAASGNTTVYITRTGECYHTSSCSYLKSKISISLSDAVASGYRACSRCHPPTLDKSSNSAKANDNTRSIDSAKSSDTERNDKKGNSKTIIGVSAAAVVAAYAAGRMHKKK